jgi:hypothetical protein
MLNKPKVLFVTEKWCDGNPKMGMSNSEHNLFGSLERSGLADYSRLHFDEYYLRCSEEIDTYLIGYCFSQRPSVVVSTYLLSSKKYNISASTWQAIRSMGIPVVFIWFDFALPLVQQCAYELLACSDLNIVLDVAIPAEYSNLTGRLTSFWTPQDTGLYRNDHLLRDIDVCFLGSVAGYQDRTSAIECLREHGINVFHMGGQRERPLPVEAYATILQRSKISLSFPAYRGVPQLVQAKGRIFETTLCGALLVDPANPQTRCWFEPGVEYVDYDSHQSLVEKVRYYLAHDAERNAIAAAGCLRASTQYSAVNFWRKVFNQLAIAC